jgi:hypothetical protein
MAFFVPPGVQRKAPEGIFQVILGFFVPKLGNKESNLCGKKGFFVPPGVQRRALEGKKGY